MTATRPLSLGGLQEGGAYGVAWLVGHPLCVAGLAHLGASAMLGVIVLEMMARNGGGAEGTQWGERVRESQSWIHLVEGLRVACEAERGWDGEVCIACRVLAAVGSA